MTSTQSDRETLKVTYDGENDITVLAREVWTFIVSDFHYNKKTGKLCFFNTKLPCFCFD